MNLDILIVDQCPPSRFFIISPMDTKAMDWIKTGSGTESEKLSLAKEMMKEQEGTWGVGELFTR